MDLPLCVCVCVRARACVRARVCVRACAYLVETMSWNVLEVAWKVDLFVEWVVVSYQLCCD